MKKLMLFSMLLAMMATPVMAITVDKTWNNAGWASTLVDAYPGYGTQIGVNALFPIGNNNECPYSHGSVFKFGVPGFQADVTNATIRSHMVGYADGASGYGKIYWKLQHYLEDNVGDVHGRDGILTFTEQHGPGGDLPEWNPANDITVETIGGLRSMDVGTWGYYEFDVTSYVAADALAGFTNSSYRMVPCDSNGDTYPAENYLAEGYPTPYEIVITTVNVPWAYKNTYGLEWADPFPTYMRYTIPEPATITLLMLGSMLVLKRKKA